MKAIVQDRYGGPEVLRVANVGEPEPLEDEVLVRVRAASVNARDWHVMRGDPYIARVMDRKTFGRYGPNVRIRGTDFAGVVEAVGPTVRGLQPGDEVYGEAEAAFAEYVLAADSVVELKPARLSFEQAAALPTAANTALMGLRDLAHLASGQRLLVNGASGGVGTYAVQIGKAYGADVTAVCSTRNVDLVDSLGADRVIDYTREDFTRGSARYDVVLDLVGNHSLSALRGVLTDGGLLILSGGGVSRGGSVFGPMKLLIQGQLTARLARRHRIALLTAVPAKQNLTALNNLVQAGQLASAIDRTYSLAEAAEAIRYLETDHARAKVVLTV
ncbi:NADPH:quinone reductase-like Zn-dependent oxidoreductase [Kribbella amoyensis]|uniref:NADPH:quinone reductase-like Zn-dependent oxidoreductase n=1 Tax=Kribbella amoyensis TaxID=996641 RepID=A0A561BY04_9ACTN|nr:NAD(P)-dependent alcohol dehydrogenase [Kribbella amoyensis]TWD83774.1 NADPH:quinone reductase-like Zn-dependent oxidoreductase [Kribbella amoyensis]